MLIENLIYGMLSVLLILILVFCILYIIYRVYFLFDKVKWKYTTKWLYELDDSKYKTLVKHIENQRKIRARKKSDV